MDDESNDCSSMGTSNARETSSEKKRRMQYCTFCKNHSTAARKKGHACPYKNCECPLCELQRKAQVTMRHQQRVWRHQKQKLQQISNRSQDSSNSPEEKGQVCDKCRNHNELILKKNHQCPYSNCGCRYCSLTFKRRELMKHLQRVRRSNLTSDFPVQRNANNAIKIDKEAKDPQPQNLNVIREDEEGEEEEKEEEESSSRLLPNENCTHFAEGGSVSFPSSGNRLLTINEELNDGNEFEESGLSSPPPLIRTASPPPLIPLTLSPPDSPEYALEKGGDCPTSSPNERSPCGYPADRGSPPSLCPLYQEEETVLQASTRMLAQIKRLSLNKFHHHPSSSSSSAHHSTSPSTSLHNNCDNFRRSIKFGVEPEDFYLRHCNWPPSPSLSDSSSSNSSSSTSSSTPLVLEQHHQETLSPPPVNRPYLDARFSPQTNNNQMFLPYSMALRHMNPSESDLEEFPYVVLRPNADD